MHVFENTNVLRHVLGWGVGVNVHVSLPHMHMLRHIWVSPSGRSLVTAHGHVKGKHRASFQHQIPCKLQEIIKNAFQIPGESYALFVEWINSFALAKTILSKRSQPLARFSPRRVVLDL